MDVTTSRHHLLGLRQPGGLFVAAPDADYRYLWLRDNAYMLLALEADPEELRRGAYALLDLLHHHGYKIDWRVREGRPPASREWEYLHPRFSLDGEEVAGPWGWNQLDAIGVVLWSIARWVTECGLVLRREPYDQHLLQRLVWYLDRVGAEDLPDNGMWEETADVHASSLGACLAGVRAVRELGVTVSDDLVDRLTAALAARLPAESAAHDVDLALLTLVWPYGGSLPLSSDDQRSILTRVADRLGGERGVSRYLSDRYEHDHDADAQWPLGFAFLALGWNRLGDQAEARSYLERLERSALPSGEIPEAWCGQAGCDEHWHTPLGWAQALHLVCRRELAGA